jgi:hypothetical protein
VLFSGFEEPSAGREASPSIFAVDLDDDAPVPQVLGQGTFAVFSRRA